MTMNDYIKENETGPAGDIVSAVVPAATTEDGPKIAAAAAVIRKIGPLETEVYVREARASMRYRRDDARKDATGQRRTGFAALRTTVQMSDAIEEMEEEGLKPVPRRVLPPKRVDTGAVATSLLLARAVDGVPGLLEALRSSSPVVTFDVLDLQVLDRVKANWEQVIFPDERRTANLSDASSFSDEVGAIYIVAKEAPKARDENDRRRRALAALSRPVPLLAFAPSGDGYLPPAIVRAARFHVTMPPLDASIVMRTIRVVTGLPCRAGLPPEMIARLSLDDLVIAVRGDRTPEECIGELRRLQARQLLQKSSRDLPLDQLHGLGEARAWADATLADIVAWRQNRIPWSAVQSAVCVAGPPGTGKTTFGRAFAAAAQMDMMICTLSGWQASGEGHLGHLLRAMREDFAKARAKNTVMIIDEVDSFANRAEIRHSHRDYVVQVVNSMLTEIDAARETPGTILIACTNDVTRCDPAMLRAGRLNPVVHIRLPAPAEIEEMMRVRLDTELLDADLSALAEMAAGSTGADIERVVNDARRAARVADRRLQLPDLRDALGVDDDRSPEMRWRTAVHEAGHIAVDVLTRGATDTYATIAPTMQSWGKFDPGSSERSEGTRDDYQARLFVVLAGRTAEDLLLDSVSHGAGAFFGSDLSLATEIACAMVGSLGLAGPTPLVFLGDASDARAFLVYDEVRAAVHRELADAEQACRSLLQRHRDGLEAVAQRLLERERIDGAEVRALLEAHKEAPNVG